MYGTQTILQTMYLLLKFENDVKMYGTQTGTSSSITSIMFENDVKMYGTQTYHKETLMCTGLRMM